MQYIVFDIETNGIDNCDKIHCLSYTVVGDYVIHTIYNKEDIVAFFQKPNTTYLGHYIANYDLPVIQKLYSVNFDEVLFYDTIFLSNYIFPGRLKYGLEDFGVDYGVPKVKVGKDEWDGDMNDPAFNLLMTNRCEGDVKINTNLWVNIKKRLEILYEGDMELIEKFLRYMAFKARLALTEQLNPLLVNTKGAEDLLIELYKIKSEKEDALKLVMPKIPVYTIKKKPKVMYKQDKTISSLGQKWLDFLVDNNLPADTTSDIKVFKEYLEPNPQSNVQIKNWLYELSWQPCTWRYERNKETGERKQIPQILNEEKELTDSVRVLLDKVPELELLEGLGVVNHRIGFLEGLLEVAYKNDGWVPQTLKAVASTLRFKHKTIVNLPSIHKTYGKEIRSLFVAPEGMLVCGVDVKNLESRTRDHSIQPLDPEYVKEMSDPSFDSHLDIAVVSGLLTEQQSRDHKDGVADYSKQRKVAKQVNFASVYNVGPKTLSINTGFSEDKCRQLLEAYWKRNWSVKEYANSLAVKNCLGRKWVKSELGEGWWLELRSDNDRFSAHNQNAGVMFFDTWCGYLSLHGIVIRLQMHDEILIYVDPLELDKTKAILQKCCVMANKKLNLNITINLDIQIGSNYGQVH